MRQSCGSPVWRVMIGAALLCAVGGSPVGASGLSFSNPFYQDAWSLLSAEIARDQGLTSHGINRARMTLVQQSLAPDLERKQEMVEVLSGMDDPLLTRIRGVLASTLADEKRIVEGGTTDRYRRSAERTLKSNLTRKEDALAALEEEGGR